MNISAHTSGEPSLLPARRLWVRLILFALIVGTGLSLLIWMGTEWSSWVERLTQLHPLLFLLAMSLLPVAGFPISAFYFYAGIIYGPVTGIPVCLTALAANMTLSYLVTRFLLRAPLKELLRRRGHEVPDLRTSANQFRVTFLIRTVPGPPFPVQNYLLAAAGVPFRIYLPVSLLTQGVIGSAIIASSGLLTLHVEPWILLSGAVVLFLLAGLGGTAFFKRRDRRSLACSVL